MTITRSIWILILLPIAFFFTTSTVLAREATVVESKSAIKVEQKAQVDAGSRSATATVQASSKILAESVKPYDLDHEAIVMSDSVTNTEAVEGALNAAFIYTNGVENIKSSQTNLGSVWVATGEVVSVAQVLRRGIDLNDFRRSCNCEERGTRLSPPVITPVSTVYLTSLHADSLPHKLGAINQVLYVGQANSFDFVLSMITFALIVFLYSWYLRFRSGIAPGRAFVVS